MTRIEGLAKLWSLPLLLRGPLRGPLRGLLPCLAVCLMLGGCSSLMHKLSGNDDASADKAKAGQPVPTPVEHAVYKLQVDTPTPALTKLLSNYLDLARFQSLPVTDSITVAELDRLVADAPAQAQQLLQTEGYFNAKVTISRDQAAAADAASPTPSAAASAADAITTTVPIAPITVHVEPGRRARVSQIDITATGPLQDAVAKGDKRAASAMATLKNDWPMKAGTPFRQPDWTTAKDSSLAQLRANGYAAANWTDTSAQVDAATDTVTLKARVDSGPLFRLGELKIEGLERYSPDVVRNLAGFGPGAPYSEKLLLDYQERLQKVGLFGGVVVEIDPDISRAAATPVTVRVRELTLHQTTLGAGFTTNTGERVTLEHLQRNVFGTGWQARNNFTLGHALQSWQGQLTSNPDQNQWRKLIAGGAERSLTGDDTNETLSVRVGKTKETERVDRLYYAELLRTSVTNSLASTRADAAWFNYSWIWRELDSVLLPTRGRSLSLQLGTGVGRGDTAGIGPFGRALSRLTYYRPLGDNWYAQARIEGGQVLAADNTGIPDTLLFRAGGDDSVRGYAYRSLGPNVNGLTVSGRVLMTSSLEIARPILASLPTLWGAAFIDAGNAAADWGHLKPAVGYGVGVRLRSPVGPLRIDLAYGEQVRQFRLHLSVGVTF